MPEVEIDSETERAATIAAPSLGARVWLFWNEIHTSCLAPKDELRRLDARPLVVLLVSAVSLMVIRFAGKESVFALVYPPPAGDVIRSTNWELWSMAWWSGCSLVGYMLLPVIAICCLPGERLRDYGWSWKGFRDHWRMYVLLYLLVLPLAVVMSRTASFKNIYPFYKLANRSAFDFAAWQAIYAAQFVGLEFFFRGFMLHGTKRSLGAHAIWVMVIPYCMIHFGKTFAESAGAIVAGLVLGTISLRTDSIWGGVAIHVAVAVTMDLLTVGYL
jgi:membrane protease YdiL (CAAX protease family)